jgi:tetratricopeptide (TPR) repeat protein
MLTLLIALAVGGACGYFARAEWGWGWGVICGVAGFMATQLAAGLLLRGAIKRRQDRIQTIMQTAQQRINKQLNLFQIRPPSGMRAAQQTLEKLQNDAAKQALAATEDFRSLYLWNLMLKRQIAAMKGQLYYQLREFKKAQESMEHAMIMDPQSTAIRMALFYRDGDRRLDKFYSSKSRRFKSDDAAFVASVYAWIKLKQGDAEAARQALTAARKNSDHPVLLENHSKLMNGKEKQFSNAGFGDLWYALYLEEPKVKPQRQRQGRPF